MCDGIAGCVEVRDSVYVYMYNDDERCVSRGSPR